MDVRRYQVTTKLSAKLKEPSPCSLDQARADTTVPYRLGLLLAFDPPLSKVWRVLGTVDPRPMTRSTRIPLADLARWIPWRCTA